MIIDVMLMSGVEDGLTLSLNAESQDGFVENQTWTLTIGRSEDNDICLRNDTYVSRQHARLHFAPPLWVLEDNNSKNGSFLESDNGEDDARITGTVSIEVYQLFRIGRTWLRLQPPSA